MAAFAADPVLTDCFGEELSTTIVEVRRGEIALFEGMSAEAVAAATRWRH